MLNTLVLAVVLSSTPPIPLPRPDLAGANGTASSEGIPAPEATITPPPRDLDDQTVLELILGDLNQIGSAPSPGETEDPPAADLETTVAITSVPTGGPTENNNAGVLVPLPVARPIVLLPQASRPRTSGSSLCGDPRLSGTMISRVRGKISACGIAAPVQLTAVNGIKLSTPAKLRCDAARTFADWLTGVADPHAREDLGAGLASVWVMASYSCRTRNHRKGARLSEHSYGRAIDIGGMTLINGRKVTVLEGWNKGSAGRYLRRIWRRACGPFKTVLGPESDRFHRNHFHFDIAQRRNAFCR